MTDIEEALSSLLIKLSDIENDLAFDRSKLDDIQNRLTSLESRLKSLEDLQPRIQNKMHDAVQDALQPLVGAVNDARKTKKKGLVTLLKNWIGGDNKWLKK